MTTEDVHIILPSVSVGGVEKRLAGLFAHLAARGRDVRLVASRELVRLLEQSSDLGRLASHRDRVEVYEAGANPFAALRARLRTLFATAPDAVYHYGLASPLRLHASRSPRTLYTIPNASLAQYNARGLVEVYGGVLRATRVDVLDPSVFATLARRFPWRRGSFSLTPGSFVDLDVYTPLPAAQKVDALAFTGLFSHEKQAPRLVACIPELLSRLDAAGFPSSELWMMGRDPEGGAVSKAVAALDTPRVRAWFEAEPGDVLARAKVFLSLQRSTNHPSKALLEAMACGCAPVVTDTRDSRRTAPESLASYVPRDFTAADLARAAVPLLAREPQAVDAHAARMRSFLAQRFSLDAMASYYEQLYEQLRALPVGRT